MGLNKVRRLLLGPCVLLLELVCVPNEMLGNLTENVIKRNADSNKRRKRQRFKKKERNGEVFRISSTI